MKAEESLKNGGKMAKAPLLDKAKDVLESDSFDNLKKSGKIKRAPKYGGDNKKTHHIAEDTMKEAVVLAMSRIYIPKGVRPGDKNIKKQKGKPVKKSVAISQKTVFHDQLNPNDVINGGQVMQEMDRVSSIAARMHSGEICVTRSSDGFDFKAPAKLGDILTYRASVNRVWNTSMEVGVRVDALNPETGEMWHINSNYFTYIAMDENGQKTTIVPVIPSTKEEKRRFEEAEKRRKIRLKNRK
ncbi:MAG: acyl-CoA thioesterase [bacterium]|nr:acyl-CoA thioesterase [bacterium]